MSRDTIGASSSAPSNPVRAQNGEPVRLKAQVDPICIRIPRNKECPNNTQPCKAIRLRSTDEEAVGAHLEPRLSTPVIAAPYAISRGRHREAGSTVSEIRDQIIATIFPLSTRITRPRLLFPHQRWPCQSTPHIRKHFQRCYRNSSCRKHLPNERRIPRTQTFNTDQTRSRKDKL